VPDAYERALQSTALGGSWRGKGGGDTTQAPQRVGMARVSVPQECAGPWIVTAGPPRHLGTPDISCDTHRAYVELKWGTGTVTHRAEIDLRQGWQMQVAGSFVDATVHWPEGLAATGFATDEIDWPLSIAPGPCQTTRRLTRTIYLGDVDAGVSRRAGVPPFAYAFYVLSYCNFAAPFPSYQLRQRDRGLAPITELANANHGTSANRNYLEHGWQAPCVIAPGCTVVLYTNNNADPHEDVKLVFELAL